MKIQSKRKTISANKLSKCSKKISKILYLDGMDKNNCHFKLVAPMYSGKLIHFRETSYLPLTLALIALGLVLFNIYNSNNSPNVLGSSTILVTAVVPEPDSTVDAKQDVVINTGVDLDANLGVDGPAAMAEITNSTKSNLDSSLQNSLFGMLILLYLLLLVVTLGLWVSNSFDRRFKISKYYQKMPK